MARSLSVAQGTTRCAFDGFCKQNAAPGAAIHAPGEFPCAHRHIKAGQILYRAGDELHSIYPVKAGCLKATFPAEGSRDQVVGFYMRSDLVGLDAIGSGKYATTVTALEDSEVCMLPYGQLEDHCQQNNSLRRRFESLLGRELNTDKGSMAMLGSMTAEERMATFILNMSARFSALGYSASEFRIQMTRDDMGSYLGLRLETVSRILHRLQDLELLAINGRELQILDRPALERIAHARNEPRRK